MSDAIERVRAYLAWASGGTEPLCDDTPVDDNAPCRDQITVGDLRELLAIAEARGWRSVADDPPDTTQGYARVLVVYRGEVHTMEFDGMWWAYDNGVIANEPVPALWQPLPPPPKESDERTPRAVD